MSFRLLETGGGKARHVSLNGRFRADVLTGDWCFQRHPAAQTFSYSASGLRHPVWHVEKADAELSFAANRLLEGEIRVFRGRVRTGVLTSDWRFRRPPAAQPFSYSAGSLRELV